MNVRFLALIVALAGCRQTPSPVCPTGGSTGPTESETAVDTQATVETKTETETDPDVASTTSVDGLFACSRPRGELEITMREGFTAKDLVIAYIGITCANVLLPIELADRSRKTGFHGRLKPAEIEPRFRVLFEELGLALVRKDGIAIVVDQAWLARRPGLVLLARADPTSMLLSSSPSVPPPLDDPPEPSFDGIARLSDTHVVITRATADAAIAASPKSARIVPSLHNGQPNGVKLYAVRPTGIYAGLGIRNGDTVHSINGAAITGVADFTLSKLLATSHVELAITRRGTPMTLVIDIRD